MSERLHGSTDAVVLLKIGNAEPAKLWRSCASHHPCQAKPIDIDAQMYKWRHLIENVFCKLKEFKRIAMRADKTDERFAAVIYLAAAVINSRWISTQPIALNRTDDSH